MFNKRRRIDGGPIFFIKKWDWGFLHDRDEESSLF